MDSNQIGIVVGLKAEARIARKLGWPVAVGGGSAAGAASAAASLLAQGVSGLVSFGLAGGLDPYLLPGDILVPTHVLVDDTRLACDPALMAKLGGASPHLLLGGEQIIPTAHDKREIHRATGAHAVDLETAALARLAQAHGLPFAVLRAVCDPANCSLPPAAQVALNHHGAIGLGRVLLSVLRMPGQIGDLRALAKDAARARAALLARVTALAA